MSDPLSQVTKPKTKKKHPDYNHRKDDIFSLFYRFSAHTISPLFL